MKNTWGVVSLDGIQKSLVSQSPFGISILGASFLQCFSYVHRLVACTHTVIPLALQVQ